MRVPDPALRTCADWRRFVEATPGRAVEARIRDMQRPDRVFVARGNVGWRSGMMRWLACMTVAVVLASPVFAQQAAPHGGFDCRMLAGMPNAPMTVESCERRMAVHADMMSALETPGGERPGDDRMNCEAIVAELKTMNVAAVSSANAAEGRAAAASVMAIMQRAQAEAMGMMGTQTARTAAAAPLPGNAAGQAAAMANMAEQKAMQDRLAAEMSPARDRLEVANTNAIGDLVKAMRANPRFARLVKLGGERGCRV